MFKALSDAKGRMVYRAVVKKELEAYVSNRLAPVLVTHECYLVRRE
jgi:hypothetical protein